MPVVQISLYRGRSAEQKLSVCRCIQRAVKDTFGIRPDNFFIGSMSSMNPICSSPLESPRTMS